MAAIYLRSTTGNNANDGLTWATAKATFIAALTAAGVGGTVYVSYLHSETLATGNNSGVASPGVYVLGVNDNAQPPTELKSGAVLTFANTLTTVNGSIHFKNIKIVTSGGKMATISNNQIVMEDSNTVGRFTVGSTSTVGMDSNVLFKNMVCEAVDQFVLINAARLNFEWRGGSLVNPSAFNLQAVLTGDSQIMNTTALLEGVDLSAAGTSTSMFYGMGPGRFIVMNCKLPVGWAGTLGTNSGGTMIPSQYFELYNCDSGATNYRVRLEQWVGSLRDETSIVKVGGASDGTTPLSWKITTNANPIPFPLGHKTYSFRTQEIFLWNDTADANSSLTVDIDILNDGRTLTNADIALTASYPGDATSTLGSVFSNQLKILESAVSHTTSGATWSNTGGMTAPVKQKLSLSLLPRQKGPIVLTIMVARPNLTVYIDPKVTTTTAVGGGAQATL